MSAAGTWGAFHKHEIRVWLGETLIFAERPEPADAVVVLGGDFLGPRVVKGADLAKEGYAPIVLISGPPYFHRPESEIAVEFLVSGGYAKSQLESFAHRAKSTIAEMAEVARELRRRKVRRVLLVTSDYHSRRAWIVFRLFAPELHVRSVPSTDNHLHPKRWWLDAKERALVASEWKKIAGTLILGSPHRALAADSIW
ncbi:MAG: YdcF family protein [Bryobacteraceae bacterium]|nr:YdcF family protein [Bryobacteraceae bacterium]